MVYAEEGFEDYVEEYEELLNDQLKGDDICEQLETLKQSFKDCEGHHEEAKKYIRAINEKLVSLKCPK